MKNLLPLLLVLVLVGAGAYLYKTKLAGKVEEKMEVSQKTTEETKEVTPSEAMVATDGLDEEAVDVIDQLPGSTVVVSMVSTKKPVFVMIHKLDEEGNPGAVIGSSGLITKDSEKVTIKLTERMVQNSKYTAMLHTDDGDGKLTFPGPDAPTKDSAGEIVMMDFMASTTAVDPSEL